MSRVSAVSAMTLLLGLTACGRISYTPLVIGGDAGGTDNDAAMTDGPGGAGGGDGGGTDNDAAMTDGPGGAGGGDGGGTNDGYQDLGTPDGGSDVGTDASPDTAPPGSVPMFIAVGYGFRRVLSCTDGLDWQLDQVEVPNPGSNNDSLALGLGTANGLFVAAVGGGGLGARIITTADGVIWTERVPKGSYNGFSQVSYGNGYFVAGGGNISIRSANGLTGWGDVTVMGSSGGILRHMAWGGGHFVAVGANRVEYGTNGVDWMAAPTGTCGDPVDVIYGGGRFLAVDNAGVTCVSADGGMTWTKGNVGGGTIRGLAWTGSGFLVTATDQTYRSPDGAAWTSTTGGGPATIARSDKGTYVGMGNSGFVYSTDGMTWLAAPSPASPGNNAITRIVFGYGAASATCPASAH